MFRPGRVSSKKIFPPPTLYPSVGCYVEPTSGGHPRPGLCPSLNFSMGALLAPKAGESATVSEIPGTGHLH